MSKRIVISGYYGFDNFGDEAILSVLLNHLKQFDVEVVVLSSSPRKTSMNYLVNSIYSFDFHQVSGLIKQSDILISGGGSLLQDVTSLKSLIYYLWVIFTALRYKKKVIIFAQGIGPIRNNLARFVTTKILKNCDYISVRDYKSQKMLEFNNVKADLLCDPIFSLNLVPAVNKGIVGVQLRDFATLNDALLNKLARQLIKEFYNKKIELYALQYELDFHICDKFKKILNSIAPNIDVEIVHSLPLSKMIERMSNLEYMIAMRYHALVVALKLGIACVGINYDAKVEKLAHDASIPLISMKGLEDFDQVFSALKTLNKKDLCEYANSMNFDWSKVDEIITE